LERLEVSPSESIAFEDSSNGVQAAKAAGLFCVAVPNPLTADLDLSEADLRLLSLDAMPLREGIKEASSVRKRRARCSAGRTSRSSSCLAWHSRPAGVRSSSAPA